MIFNLVNQFFKTLLSKLNLFYFFRNYLTITIFFCSYAIIKNKNSKLYIV